MKLIDVFDGSSVVILVFAILFFFAGLVSFIRIVLDSKDEFMELFSALVMLYGTILLLAAFFTSMISANIFYVISIVFIVLLVVCVIGSILSKRRRERSSFLGGKNETYRRK